MKHVYAGLIVGFAAAAGIAVTLFTWWLFAFFIGPQSAAVLTALIIFLGVAAAILDYTTEQRGKA